MVKSTVNCKFCGSLLAEPTGGKARLYGKLNSIVDELPEITIRSVQEHPEKKSVNLLLDTMIIHQLINGKSIHELTDYIYNSSLKLIVLDRILIETEHMEKDKYGVLVTGADIINELEKVGTVESIRLNHATEPLINARELYQSKKYVNSYGVELSETDCILLQMALTLDDVTLVTQDKTLMRALQKEKEILALFD